MPIDLNLLEDPINRCILVKADELVASALRELEQAGGENWWHLVVELGEGRFAATQFNKLSPLAQTEGFEFFNRTLGSLVDSWIPVVLMVEQSEIGTEAAKDLAYESPGRVLVVTKEGKFLGVIYRGEAGGELEEAPLLSMFREYLAQSYKKGAIPDNGGERRREPPARYANAVLQTADGDRLKPDLSIAPGSAFYLRLDIGELSKESAVIRPEPIPEHLLPRDTWLDVMVSSTDFSIGTGPGDLGQSTAHGRFFLARDGSPARTEAGDQHLFFYVLAPLEAGTARARIAYYYHNHLVQSQLLSAVIGYGEGGFRVEIDYTLSRSLLDLGELPSRKQVSIVTNSNGGDHQIVVRPGDSEGNIVGQACTYRLKEDVIDPVVTEIRGILRDGVAREGEKWHRKQDLVRDLQQLAPLGRKLWHVTVSQCIHEVYEALKVGEKVVIHVSRPTTADYTFPWSLIYDIPLSDEPRNWKLCPLVEEWDDRNHGSKLVEPGTRRCPKAPNGRHERDTLCPFGFWGYLHDIEQLSSTDTPVLNIPIPASRDFEVVAALTQYGIDLNVLTDHLEKIEEALTQSFSHGKLQKGEDLKSIQKLLGNDSPFIYFFSHGERATHGDPDTYLGVGNREKLRAQDFQDWVQEWLVNDGRTVWDKTRPLIFINACHSVEINTKTLVTYLDAFITTGHAAGVIGTEVKVRPSAAMDFALEFCRLFFAGKSVGQALHHVRTDYLAHGNLYGLIYTPYCWSDLAITRQ